AIAIYRPGPMESIPIFLENRQNPEKIRYKAPALEKILHNTSGCIIYQEQVMQICREIAGFSYGRADIIRRAMSKKKSAEMEKERKAFIYGDTDETGKVICRGAVANGISEETAGEIFDTLAKFASYAFNKAHACAYAFISYRTAYLKAHYPCEFIAALLSSVLGNVSKTAVYVSEAQKSKISVLPPDINESLEKYSVVTHDGSDAIRFGLLGIKNVGITLLSQMIAEREKHGNFSSFVDFIDRMSYSDLNKRQIEALIKSGAFDELGTPRSMLLSEYEKIIDIYLGVKKTRDSGQLDLFSLGSDEHSEDRASYEFEPLPEISMRERIKQEKESTGMYFSGHPTDDYAANIEYLGAVPISDILLSFDESSDEHIYSEKQVVTVAGIITSRTNKRTRKDEPMAFVTIEDKFGEIELVIFPKVLENCSYMLANDIPIAATGEISAGEESAPKILVREVSMLSQSFVPPAEKPKTEQAPKQTSVAPSTLTVQKPTTLYLKVESMTCKAFERAENLLMIFKGSTPVVFYDASSGKYIKANGLSTDLPPVAMGLLREILGENNVVQK
ncbi:MAG: DNA polymerase III subunit alpha, partial [Clostridiales bacterium]|nr:DNA polymerase III subunit alpha [Clostridiales bacterium]